MLFQTAGIPWGKMAVLPQDITVWSTLSYLQVKVLNVIKSSKNTIYEITYFNCVIILFICAKYSTFHKIFQNEALYFPLTKGFTLSQRTRIGLNYFYLLLLNFYSVIILMS